MHYFYHKPTTRTSAILPNQVSQAILHHMDATRLHTCRSTLTATRSFAELLENNLATLEELAQGVGDERLRHELADTRDNLAGLLRGLATLQDDLRP